MINNKLKEIESQLQIITNNLSYHLDQFDSQLSLAKKEKSLHELETLITKFDSLNKKAKEEFYTASQLSKSEFHNSLKEYTKSYKVYSNDIIERKNLFRILSMRTNSFQVPNLNIDLGHNNQHLLDYSRIRTVLNDARQTYETTKTYLTELENDIKEKPLIDADDPAYKSYLNYMTKKQEMINKQKRTTCKYITFGIIALLIIFAILYYIIFCIEGSDDMDIDEF